MTARLALLSAVASAAALAAVPRAAACSFEPLREHATDPDEVGTDTSQPHDLRVRAQVARGQGPERAGCSRAASSCDDIGVVILTVDGASDDRTAIGDLGYELVLAGGALPQGMALPDTAVVANRGEIVLPWIDGATDDQEPVSFELEVTPIDRGGNRGDPVRVAIADPGTKGCRASGGGGAPASAPLWVAAAAWATRRRRAR